LLADKVSGYETAEANAKKEVALNLCDAAIADGRLDAKAKESMLNLFDKDFEAAKLTLDSIAKPIDIKGALNLGDKGSERSQLEALTFDEIDRKGKLLLCKDSYNDLYVSKFKEKFGTEPK
jgi:uncharacterized membrane protein YebE (DUF533 family)